MSEQQASAESLISVPIRRKISVPIPASVRKGRAADLDACRAWTPVGILDGGAVADVDRHGLINLRGMPWSVDWWIGAEDRWHFASMEAAVRQSSMDSTPLLETMLRVPGGDILQRVGGVASGGAPSLRIEIENQSAVPVALALVIRPWRLDSAGSVDRVTYQSSRIEVDSSASIVTSTAPLRVVSGSSETTAIDLSEGNDAVPGADYVVTSDPPGGSDLEVAFVYALPHTATLTALVSPEPAAPSRWKSPLGKMSARRTRNHSAPSISPAQAIDSAPALPAVVKGWKAHGEDDPTISFPLREWGEFVRWSASMLRLSGTEEVTRILAKRSHQSLASKDSAAVELGTGADRLTSVAHALSGLDPAACDSIAAALVTVQRSKGEVRLPDRSDGSAALLFSAAGTLRAPWGATRADDFVGPVAKAIANLGSRPDQLRDDEREALGAVAAGLVRIGQPDVAEDALALAASEVPATELADNALAESGQPVCEFVAARMELRQIRAGNLAGLESMAKRIAARSDLGVSEQTDATGRPVGSLGFDISEVAATRLALMNTAVGDHVGGPIVLPIFPTGWREKPLEARAVPTGWGEVSMALRWHDGTPVLLWEIAPWFGARGSGSAPVLRCPGLDPGWIGVGWEGEAFLDAASIG